MEVDGLRQPERFEHFLLACEADARGRKGLEDRPYPQGDLLRAALRAARSVEAARVRDELEVDGEALGRALREARLAAVKAALRDRPPAQRP